MLSLNLKVKPRDIAIAAERAISRLCGTYANDNLPISNFKRLRDLSEEYGILIVSEAESDDPHGQFLAPEEGQKQLAAELLTGELPVYTKEMLKATHVERIVICKGLAANGRDLAGLAQMGPFVVDTLFLDMDYVARNWDFARTAFHHEVFHAIDYCDDYWHYVDTNWFHLNDPDFRYAADLCGDVVRETNKPGFLTDYSMVAVHEDKAEIYAHLIIDHMDVIERANDDPVLHGKVVRMKQLLHQFCGDYNAEFWDMIDKRSLEVQGGSRMKWRKEIEKFLREQEAIARKQQGILDVDHCTLKVWVEDEKDKRKWCVALCTTNARSCEPPVSYHTFDRLKSTLIKLHVSDLPEKDDIRAEAMVLNGRAPRPVLERLGLI